jgi:hypothetical protein
MKDQISLSCLYQKENKLKKASNGFEFDKIKTKRYKIDHFKMDKLDTYRLNALRDIRNEKFDIFVQ